jgi:alpha-glucosidase
VTAAWWRDAVVYQVYPRSFQDSDGDGVGDLPGIASRLEHVRDLGADALWLSPIYPSPMADGGYDVSDYRDVHPALGTLSDFDALLARAHGLGLRVVLDVVPCHTSIEHPWFREHPERYVIRPGDRPPNNWLAAFGGSAWSPDPYGRGWYLHSFYPEQPDLDWRNSEVRELIGEVLRFWLARGVDGFRLDALAQLMKDPRLRDDARAREPFPLPIEQARTAFALDRSGNAPDIGEALASLREAAGDAFLVGEVYLPTSGLSPYLEHLDGAFCFELLFAGWDAARLAAVIDAALRSWPPAAQVGWVLSNHDFSRLASRVGEANTRAAALLLLALPGVAFVYQGDEIGMADGPGGDPPHDAFGRDPFRHPMQWVSEPGGGFTSGIPWLPIVDAQQRNVAAAKADPDSLLALYRDVIALRRDALTGPVDDLRAHGGVLSFRRGGHVVALNTASAPQPAPPAGAVVRATHANRIAAGAPAPRQLQPGEGFIAHARAN